MARSRGCIVPFRGPTRPSLSTPRRMTSLVRNCSRCTTSPTLHRPRCSRLPPTTRRAKGARALQVWRWQTFGTSERNYSASAMQTKMRMRVGMGKTRSVPRPHDRPMHTRRRKIPRKTRNRQSRSGGPRGAPNVVVSRHGLASVLSNFYMLYYSRLRGKCC